MRKLALAAGRLEKNVFMCLFGRRTVSMVLWREIQWWSERRGHREKVGGGRSRETTVSGGLRRKLMLDARVVSREAEREPETSRVNRTG